MIKWPLLAIFRWFPVEFQTLVVKNAYFFRFVSQIKTFYTNIYTARCVLSVKHDILYQNSNILTYNGRTLLMYTQNSLKPLYTRVTKMTHQAINQAYLYKIKRISRIFKRFSLHLNVFYHIMIRKWVFHEFKGAPMAHLFNPRPLYGSPEVKIAENVSFPKYAQRSNKYFCPL